MEKAQRKAVRCKSSRGSVPCFAVLALPEPKAFLEPQSPIANRDWPDPAWEADLACSHCGTISRYAAADILDHWRNPSRDLCHRVLTECFQASCRSAVEFYLLSSDYEVGRNLQDEPLKALCTGEFRGTCSHGHNLLPVPAIRSKITPFEDWVPSAADSLCWTRPLRERTYATVLGVRVEL